MRQEGLGRPEPCSRRPAAQSVEHLDFRGINTYNTVVMMCDTARNKKEISREKF